MLLRGRRHLPQQGIRRAAGSVGSVKANVVDGPEEGLRRADRPLYALVYGHVSYTQHPAASARISPTEYTAALTSRSCTSGRSHMICEFHRLLANFHRPFATLLFSDFIDSLPFQFESSRSGVASPSHDRPFTKDSVRRSSWMFLTVPKRHVAKATYARFAVPCTR